MFADARTVIVLLVLLATICGATARAGMRTTPLRIWASSVASECDTKNVRMTCSSVQGSLLDRVGDDHDRAFVDDFEEELIARENLCERLIEGDATQLDRVNPVLVVAFERDVDAGRHPHRIQDVAQAGVVEYDVDRLARRGIEQRFRRLACRLLELSDVRLRTRCLGQIPKPTLHLERPARDLAVARIELAGATVFPERLLELTSRFEQPRLIQVLHRRRDHGALECDTVVGAVRILLKGAAEVLDRGIPIAGTGRTLALAIRPTSAASREEGGDDEQ